MHSILAYVLVCCIFYGIMVRSATVAASCVIFGKRLFPSQSYVVVRVCLHQILTFVRLCCILLNIMIHSGTDAVPSVNVARRIFSFQGHALTQFKLAGKVTDIYLLVNCLVSLYCACNSGKASDVYQYPVQKRKM